MPRDKSNLLNKGMATPFKQRFAFDDRRSEAERIREKFPDRIPVIVERSRSTASVIPHIDKEKFLVPGDLSVSQFIFIIRRRLNLDSDTALFVYIGNTLPTTGTLLRELYRNHGDSDGFLYLTYCGENTFGWLEEPVHRYQLPAHWRVEGVLSH